MMDKPKMIYGLRPVYEALTAGKEIEKVFIQKGLRGNIYADVWQLIRAYHIPFQFVPAEKLTSLVRGNHQGIVAYTAAIEYTELTTLVPFLFEQGELPFLLVLDRITDVRNFGAIARTASCAGVHGLVIPVRGSAMIHADAIKTSAGALQLIPVCRVGSLSSAVSFLKESGLQIAAISEKAEQAYDRADFRGPLALIMGSEEDGISADLLRLSDEQLAIPMQGEIASLNVSVAAGILMFEVARQRRATLQ